MDFSDIIRSFFGLPTTDEQAAKARYDAESQRLGIAPAPAGLGAVAPAPALTPAQQGIKNYQQEGGQMDDMMRELNRQNGFGARPSSAPVQPDSMTGVRG